MNPENNNVHQSKGLSIASLVLGIVSILISFFFGFLPGILAVIFGIIGYVQHRGRGMALAGIITGSAGILLNLLFIMLVFVSLPALQRSQADTQRKSDTSRFISQVTDYQANNKGALPSEDNVASFITGYLEQDGSTFNDPNGNSYQFVPHLPTQLGQMYYKTGVTCNGSGTDFTPATDRQFGVIVKLSTGVYCASS